LCLAKRDSVTSNLLQFRIIKMKTQELIIEAGNTEGQYWKDLWRYRGLCYYLAWRDILVRYKQTAIGVAWALIRPFVTMVVFTLLFGKLARLPSEGVAYPVLVFAGLLPWQLFANSLTECSNSMLKNSSMISRIYFPRLIAPLSAVLTSLVDFFISVCMLAGLMVWFGVVPDWRLLTVPLFVLIALVSAIGAGLWFGALNVKYRDFQQVVPFIVQFGLYASPVAYSIRIIPEHWRLVYSLNPMVGVIDGFRWAVLGSESVIYWPGLLLSLSVAVLLLSSGIWYFRKTEQSFADFI
jgi:lipopolysaccharide transport system permease protein